MPDSRSPFTPGDSILFYTRDSGGETQDQSVDQQIAVLKPWAAAHGLQLHHIYTDRARPGGTDVGREQFQQMIADLRTGLPVAGVVMWKFDRFGRNYDDAQFFKADLRRRGYIVHSLMDTIPEGREGRFVEAAIDWMSERFREDLSANAKRGLQHLVRQFGCVPGTPPLGFRRIPVELPPRRDGAPHTGHRWEPDPDWIPRLQEAYTLRADGATLAAIHAATRLYASLNCYTTFFRNELYIGTLHYGGQAYPNYCPPVIDADTWARVQHINQLHRGRQHLTGQNPSHPRRHATAFSLSGLLTCARCDAPLNGHTSRQKHGDPYRRYECSRAKRLNDCDLPRIPAKALEDLIIHSLRAYVVTPTALQHVLAQTIAAHGDRNKGLRVRINDHKKRLTGIRQRLANLDRAIQASGHSPTLLASLATLEAEQASLQDTIAALTRQDPAPEALDQDQLAAKSAALITQLQSGDPANVRAVLAAFVQNIRVDRDKEHIRGLVTYYYPPDAKKKPRPKTGSITAVPLGAPGLSTALLVERGCVVWRGNVDHDFWPVPFWNQRPGPLAGKPGRHEPGGG